MCVRMHSVHVVVVLRSGVMPWCLRTLPTVCALPVKPRLARAPTTRSSPPERCSWAMRTINASSSWSIVGRPGDCRCWEPSNFWATRVRCQPRIVSGLTIWATPVRACLPSFWPITARALALAITQPEAAVELAAADTVVRHQLFVAQQQCLIDGPRDRREQVLPIHRLSPGVVTVYIAGAYP